MIIDYFCNKKDMKQEKYSLKDFGINLEMNFTQRADYFQNYINQLDASKHQAYLAEAITGIGANMTVRDIYTGEPRNVVSFVANDYLGLSRHPQTINAGVEALKKYGTGACAAPIIGGFLEEHRLLEKEIAEFIGQENALLFSSGYGLYT